MKKSVEETDTKKYIQKSECPERGCTYEGKMSMIKVRFLGLDKFKVLFENVMRFIEEHGWKFSKEEKRKPGLWEMLLAEGQHDLIEKLRRVEREEGGFGTIVVPEGGFSDNKETHDMVVAWLEKTGTNVLDVKQEITELEEALRGGKKKKEAL